MEPSQSCTSHQGGDRQGVGCFTDNVVGRTGCCMDGMCPESWGGDIPSVKKAKMSVPYSLVDMDFVPENVLVHIPSVGCEYFGPSSVRIRSCDHWLIHMLLVITYKQ